MYKGFTAAILMALILVSAESGYAQDMEHLPARRYEKPPIHMGTVFFYQVGALSAMVGEVPGIIYRWHGDSTRTKILIGNTAIAVGATIGGALGVYLMGSYGDTTGSFPAALGVSSLVSAPVLALVLGDILGDGLGAYLLASLAPLGAYFAFIETYRYDSPNTALINFRNGHIGLAIPTVRLRLELMGKKKPIRIVNLVSVHF